MVHSALPRSISRTTLPARDLVIKGAGMVQRRQRERSLFEVLLPDGHKLWPDWLRKIDTLLEDEAVIEIVAQALERRWPHSRRRGRLGTPAEVVIRMLILKHLFDWSYDSLEHEVRANIVAGSGNSDLTPTFPEINSWRLPATFNGCPRLAGK